MSSFILLIFFFNWAQKWHKVKNLYHLVFYLILSITFHDLSIRATYNVTFCRRSVLWTLFPCYIHIVFYIYQKTQEQQILYAVDSFKEKVWIIFSTSFNPLTHGRFADPYFKVLWAEGKTKFLDFFFIGASATKRCARSRIFRYRCLMIILSKRQKEREGGAYSAPPPMV